MPLYKTCHARSPSAQSAMRWRTTRHRPYCGGPDEKNNVLPWPLSNLKQKQAPAPMDFISRGVSINAYAARLDRGTPLLDFLSNKFGKILGTSTLGRNDALTNGLETLAYRP
jgi:hypothetical protein